MINYQPFLDFLTSNSDWTDKLTPLLQQLPQLIEQGLNENRYGDLPRWQAALAQLPELPVSAVNINQAALSVETTPPLDLEAKLQLQTALKGLHPWRKGPFNFFDIAIDTEWHSDWKWDRLKEHIAPLTGRRVLDIGCGSGYHCWRMRGAGAELVVGIDPTPLFIVQFFALQRYINDPQISVLPMGIEQLPEKLQFFDTVFSMGVLYHRRSPFDHLIELRNALASGGELVLETLIIDGEEGEVLVPEGRYARMGNVWFLPSVATLKLWLKKVGFKDIKLIDVNVTSTEEQRTTKWMTFHSLAQFLAPDDPSKTIEGYPAPKRAILTATV